MGVRNSMWFTGMAGNYYITDIAEQRSILQKHGKEGIDYNLVVITPEHAKFLIKRLLPD